MKAKKKDIVEEIKQKQKALIPKDIKEVISKSFKSSFKVAMMMIKVYIPVFLATTVLKQVGFFHFIAPLFAPLMKLLGLPGEAAIAVILGFMDMFSGLATVAALGLTFRQVTILGVMIGIAHGLFVETAILMKLKMARLRIAFFRAILAITTGVMMNIFLPDNIKGAILNPYVGAAEFSWITTIKGMMLTCVQIIVVLFLITLAYDLIMLWKGKKMITKRVSFIPRLFGLSENAFVPWVIGLFIGIAYAAGILFQLMEKHKLSHKDTCLTTMFLILSHAIIEDVMLFAVLGGNFWWIFGIRVGLAILIVRILSLGDLYKKMLWVGLPKQTED